MLRVLFLFLLFFPLNLAYAQPDISDDFGEGEEIELGDYDPSGDASMGTLMADALESAGYKAQEIVSQQMRSTFFWIAMMVYLVSCIWALINYAIFQDTRGILWLFVGPALYFFVTRSTVTSGGAEWQYHEQSVEATEALNTVIGGNVEAEVSWAFDAYNRLISETLRQLTYIILSNDLRERLSFTVRQQMLDRLLSTQILSPELQAYMDYNLAACSREMTGARTIAQGRRDPVFANSIEYETAVRDFGQGASATWRVRDKTIPAGPVANYLRDRVFPMASTSVGSTQAAGIYTECIAETVLTRDPSTILETPVSCSDMWCWMALGLHEEVLRAAETYEDELMPENEQLKQELWEDLAAKLSKPSAPGVGSNTPDPVDIVDPSMIPTIIGGYLLRKQMSRGQQGGILRHFGERAGVYGEPGSYNVSRMSPEQREEYAQHLLHDQLASKYKWDLYSIAMMLPYLQGCILYVLSLSFPIFCLILLIPGQAKGFFVWVGMWTWAKMWNFGWALVMVIDDLLWDFMPRSGTVDVLVDPTHGPLSMLEVAFADDPAYNLSMYYAAIGALMTAVPLISAQFLLGSKAVIASHYMDGLSKVSQAFGDAGYRTKGMRQSVALQGIRERNNAWAHDHEFHTMSSGELQAQGFSSLPVEMVQMAEQLEAKAAEAQGKADTYFNAGIALGAAGGAASVVAAGGLANPRARGFITRLAGARGLPGLVGKGLLAAGASGTVVATKELGELSVEFMTAGRHLQRQAVDMQVSAMQIRERARLVAIGEDPGELTVQTHKALVERGRAGGWIRPGSADEIYNETVALVQQADNLMTRVDANLMGQFPAAVLDVIGRRTP